jgi:hypothetical protein
MISALCGLVHQQQVPGVGTTLTVAMGMRAASSWCGIVVVVPA